MKNGANKEDESILEWIRPFLKELKLLTWSVW